MKESNPDVVDFTTKDEDTIKNKETVKEHSTEHVVTSKDKDPSEVLLPTKVIGLDKLLGGGIKMPSTWFKKSKFVNKNGLVVLLKGKPGTGKSTLALQIAKGSISWPCKEQHISYYSLEHNLDIILKRIVEDEALCQKIKISQFTTDNSLEKPFTEYFHPLNWVMHIIDVLNRDLNRKKKLIIVDVVNLIRLKDREYLNISELIECLRKSAILSILIYEPADKEYDDIDYQADFIFEMKYENTPLDVLLNMISISKSRQQFSALGWHQYKFFRDGIKIFPSVHKILESENRKTKEEVYLNSTRPMVKNEEKKDDFILGFEGEAEVEYESIIARMLTKMKKGSCTAIFGPRRTSKSHLSLDFLRAGAREEIKEPGLLLSLIDNSDTIVSEKKCLYYPKCKPNDTKGCTNCLDERVFLYHWRSECVTSNEMLYYLDRRIKEGPEFKRLVFWDLTQLDFRFPLLSNDKMFLPTLIEMLNDNKITSLIMGSGKTQLTNAASSMADNVLFCWRDIVKESYEYMDNKKLKVNDEVVAIYVDRIEGEIDTIKKKLYCLPIKAEDNDIVSPLLDSSLPIRKFLLENPTVYLRNAGAEIRKIENLQGLPK